MKTKLATLPTISFQELRSVAEETQQVYLAVVWYRNQISTNASFFKTRKSLQTDAKNCARKLIAAVKMLLRARVALHPAYASAFAVVPKAVRRRLRLAAGEVEFALSFMRSAHAPESEFWFVAELLGAMFAGVHARVDRLLTPAAGAPARVVPIDLSGVTLAGEMNQQSTAETDAQFMRHFLSADWRTPSSPEKSQELDMCAEWLMRRWRESSQNGHQETGLFIAIASLPYAQPIFDETSSIAQIRNAFVLVQERIRKYGFFSSHISRAKDTRVARSLASQRSSNRIWERIRPWTSQSLQEYKKTVWAPTWASLRAALDFTPWPIELANKTLLSPIICESSYTVNGVAETLPWPLNKEKVMHSFMVFSGRETSEMSQRKNCLGIAAKLFSSFDDISLRGPMNKEALELYQSLLNQASELGCLSLQGWGELGSVVNRVLDDRLSTLPKIYFSIGNKTVVITIDQGNRRGGQQKVHRGLRELLVNWALHALSKYAARERSDKFWAFAEASLRRAPPSIGVFELSAPYWSQLSEQGIASPFDSRHWDGNSSLAEWSEEDEGYWSEARLSGETLDIMANAILEVHEHSLSRTAKQDGWKMLAQTPALYAAVGFDSAGVMDNGAWECEKTKATCQVHPQCGRIAAQMLSQSFGGAKKYAKDWGKRALTFVETSVSGQFDEDGFHSFCHAPGAAYCHSYTNCLREMMKWLCSQDETAAACCPSAFVRNECKKDVNGKGCDVCVDVPPGTNVSVPAVSSVVPKGLVEVLRAGPEDLELEKHDATCRICESFEQTFGHTDPIWTAVSSLPTCSGPSARECSSLCGVPEQADDFDTCSGWRSRCQQTRC
jgi:hypothetical protein